MTSKSDLLFTILRELRRAQDEPWLPPPSGPTRELRLPPALPLGDGRQLHVTEPLLEAVSAFAVQRMENEPQLRARFRISELEQLAERAFGQALESVDLDCRDEELISILKERVESSLDLLISQNRQVISMVLGCNLLDGDAYPIQVGPVMFRSREQWLSEQERLGAISNVTVRRLRRKWAGGRLRKRMPSQDSYKERDVVEAIGPCQVVCTVSTDGLSSKMIREKALLAARLAMMGLALMWIHPSQGLEWMNLHYDGRFYHRHYVLFGPGRYAGSSSSVSQLPSSRWTDAAILSELRSYRWMLDQIGEALFNYVQPARGMTRPNVMNALFLSLWWFYEACREPSDQIATTKFAASMDALTGGLKAKGIVALIGARLGFQPEDRLMKDGRTVKRAVAEFYDAGRSRLIHGSSDNFAHDWTSVRATAEAVGRLCLVASCDWLRKNSAIDDLRALSQI